MNLHFEVHGDGTRPFLLLVHGFLSSRAQWRPNIEALSAVSTPVVVELLGHGRSPSPAAAEAYRPASYITMFEALRERLGAERWFVCGQSFGAGLTIRYAIEYPQRVIGQVFTNSISGLSTRAEGSSAGREARAQAIESGGLEALKALPFFPRESRRLPPDIWRALVSDAERLSPSAIANAMRATLPGLSVAGELARVQVPTLLVNGLREAAFQPMRDQAAREIRGLKIVDLEGGHSVNLDQPEKFNEAVVTFVEELS